MMGIETRWRCLIVAAALLLTPLAGAAGIANLQDAIDSCDNVGPPGGARGGCTIELGTGVITITEPLRIGARGLRTYGVHLKGAGSGRVVSGGNRVECPTVVRYEGPPGESMVEVWNVRGSRISGVCFDGNDLVKTGATLRCETVAANCGEMILQDVLFTGWGPGPTVGVTISSSDDNAVAFEHIILDRVHFDSIPGRWPGPQIGVLQAVRNADHLEIRHSLLKTCGATQANVGLISAAGNFTLSQSLISSCLDAPEGSMAAVIYGGHDWFLIEGLIVEGQGRMGGIRVETGDPSALRHGAIVASEIKVPYGTHALEILAGGTLSLTGTTIGLHGGGDPSKPVRVTFDPGLKRLHLCANLRPSSFYVVEKVKGPPNHPHYPFVIDTCK